MTNKKYQNKQKNDRCRNAWQHSELFLFEPRTLFLIIITSVLTLLISFFGAKGARFLTSVLNPIPPHAPFDGTVYPIKQIPNWVKLSEAERKMTYAQLPTDKLVSVPAYNANRLAIPTNSLKWNSANDDAIRNEKISYSVPYLGNYKLDGFEGSGSHPAVDIKIPIGTPVYAMANGTVIKAANISSGFGNHIVLQHNNSPSLDDANKTETLYSSYNHLSALLVKQNDVVNKGQQIGFSGDTGTATTPHLHFQIDNNISSWHPYWPFTGAEMREAGLSFFDAINVGFKKENSVANTINPMQYVQKYFGAQALVASTATQVNQVIEKIENEVKVPEVVEPSPLVQPEKPKSIVGGFFIDVPKTTLKLYEKIAITFRAVDQNGNAISDFNLDQNPDVSLTNLIGSLSTTMLNVGNFSNGIANVEFTAQTPGNTVINITYNGRTFGTPELTILAELVSAEVIPVEPQVAVTDPLSVPPPYLVVLEETAKEPELTPQVAEGPFSDVSADNEYFEATKFLKEKGLVAGYGDGTFQPQKSVSRAEAIALILKAVNETAAQKLNSIFADVALPAWYVDYVGTAYDLGFVKGYPDGYFRPESTVNLAEFLTMLFVAEKTDIDPEILTNLPTGVAPSAWFAKYVQEAIRQDIIDVKFGTVDASSPMTRGEIAKILYRLAKKNL